MIELIVAVAFWLFLAAVIRIREATTRNRS